MDWKRADIISRRNQARLATQQLGGEIELAGRNFRDWAADPSFESIVEIQPAMSAGPRFLFVPAATPGVQPCPAEWADLHLLASG